MCIQEAQHHKVLHLPHQAILCRQGMELQPDNKSFLKGVFESHFGKLLAWLISKAHLHLDFNHKIHKLSHSKSILLIDTSVGIPTIFISLAPSSETYKAIQKYIGTHRYCDVQQNS